MFLYNSNMKVLILGWVDEGLAGWYFVVVLARITPCIGRIVLMHMIWCKQNVADNILHMRGKGAVEFPWFSPRKDNGELCTSMPMNA